MEFLWEVGNQIKCLESLCQKLGSTKQYATLTNEDITLKETWLELKCYIFTIFSPLLFPAAAPHIILVFKCLFPFWSNLWAWWRGSRLQAYPDVHSPHPSSQCQLETTSRFPRNKPGALQSLPGKHNIYQCKIIRFGMDVRAQWLQRYENGFLFFFLHFSYGKFCFISPGMHQLLLPGIRCRTSWM